MPFRLYERVGKRTVSYGYKLPDGSWAFRLSAPTGDAAARARIRTEAIDRANVLNGAPVEGGETEALFRRYFAWQRGLPVDSEERKADSTLKENEKSEAPRLLRTFGKVRPAVIKPVHIYKYLDGRAAEGAPAKANKEIALLSAVLEFGRRKGVLETNPCRDIKYNKTRPDTRYVTPAELDLVMRTARERGGMYLVGALCLRAAYLTVSRPDEMRKITRQAIKAEGLEMVVGKRKRGHAQRSKLIEWSTELRAVIDEALALQRTTSMYVFGNSDGQPYTTSGWNTNLRRLMEHARKKAEKEGIEFQRFTLKDMRPAAVTDRVDEGDETITNATGHSSDRMVKQVYDRRKTKTARATE
ncbi:tyrosine-type recombinase/integrase [Massilia varians]|uniref:tyrosine-type recombinase/integrase n=1 Tax=Massilia varians TaxID=457921 RepID=UPI0025557B83|nr:tyrosine-type recombinase/integrase [Massilia varians]MDK6077901.1 tyrosine-type recombinase/integrase [Massilia varians]